MLRSPLSVRIFNASVDVSITRRLADLEYTTSAYGGFDTCSFELAERISEHEEALAVESKVYVYDTRNGRTVWEGRLTDPGRSFDDGGHRWSMTAMGPKKHANDRFSPYIAIDSDFSGWRQSVTPNIEATASASTMPGSQDTPCILLQFNRGIAVAGGDYVTMRYDLLGDASQKIGAFRYTHQEGATTPGNWAIRGGSREISSGTVTIARDQDFDTSVRTPGVIYAGDTIGVSDDQALLRAIRTGAATNVSNDLIWAAVTSLYVIAKMRDRTGTYITGAGSYPVGYLTADLIVIDLLARFCPLYDLANATIDAGGYQIDQFAYPTGARPADMLDDIALFFPDKRWAAWETNPATGKYKFEWTGWGDQPRYEATIVDGLDLPGSSVDLFNRVTVQGVDKRGRIQSTVVTSTVPELGTLIREAEPIDMGTEVYSVANATRTGTQFLTQSAHPPASGTLTVRRPIRDLISGRIVRPWEIRAGSLIRLRGLSPSISAATATDRDGRSVFRVAATSFRDSDQTASLTLDSPSYTLAQLLARTARRRQRR